MKITETRKLTATALRSKCIENNWFTRGDNKQYADMLCFAENNDMTTENLVHVAECIIEHSNPNCFNMCAENGTTPLAYVLYELADASYTLFNIEE